MDISKYNIIMKNVFKYKEKVLIGIFLLFLQPIIVLQIPLKVQEIIDDVIPSNDIQSLIKVSSLIAGFFFLGKIIEYIFSILFYDVNCKVVRDIRSELFNKIVNGKFKDLKDHEIGDLITRVEDDIKNTRVFFVDTIAKMLSNIITLLISYYMMIKLSFTLSILIFFLFVTYISISRKYRNKIEKISEKYMKSISKSKSALIEFLNNLDVIKINNHNPYIIDFYNKTLDEKRDTNMELGKCRLQGTTIISGILNFIPYFILLIGGIMVMRDLFTIGTIIAFTEYSKRTLNSLEHLNEYNFDMGNATVSLNRINQIYYLESEEEEHNNESQDIIIEKLSIVKGGKTLVRNLDLIISNDIDLAIWGPSGSGKTTLSKVLLGIDDDYSGTISTYGYNKPYRYNGSFIKSSPYTVNGTLKENILMGKEYNHSKYEEVIKIACIKEMKKIDNVSDCSHGEKQKICLARALYVNKKMIIIDEGLSNIDVIDLETIVNNLLEIKDLTVIMITHNLNIIRKYDRVLHFSEKNIELKDIDCFNKDVNKVF